MQLAKSFVDHHRLNCACSDLPGSFSANAKSSLSARNEVPVASVWLFCVVRRRLGFSQTEFAERIGVSLDTIRNWEQGKRSPTGAATALLKVLDKAPEVALAALR